MEDLTATLFFAAMFFGPVIIACRYIRRACSISALEELTALRRAGKRMAGTLYSVPGLKIGEPNSLWRPAAPLPVESGRAFRGRVRAY